MGFRSWLLDRLGIVSPSMVTAAAMGGASDAIRTIVEAERAASIRRAALDPALVALIADVYALSAKLKRCSVGTSEDTREMRYQGRALKRWLDASTTEDERMAAMGLLSSRLMLEWRAVFAQVEGRMS